jgi:hypothetical protein
VRGTRAVNKNEPPMRGRGAGWCQSNFPPSSSPQSAHGDDVEERNVQRLEHFLRHLVHPRELVPVPLMERQKDHNEMREKAIPTN